MIFLNKLDRPGASLRESLKSIVSSGLHCHPMLLTIPVASFDESHYRSGEPGIAGLVDLVNWNVWRWNKGGESVVKELPRFREAFESPEVFPASHPLVPEIFTAREALIDGLSLHSAEFMDHFLSLPPSPSPYLLIPSSTVQSALRELSLKKAVLPVVCGAALRHIGTEVVLNFIGDLLASPVDVQGTMLESSHGSGAQVLAWKVAWDKQRGWMTFVRVYSGTFCALAECARHANLWQQGHYPGSLRYLILILNNAKESANWSYCTRIGLRLWKHYLSAL